MNIYSLFLKRVLDLVFSILLLPFFLLLTGIAGPMIFLEDHGSVFYKAKRRGKNGKIFRMYKYRSMKMNAPDIRNEDNSTYNSPDDPRITRVGKILRKTSLDEIPQILNILKGDMSFIGPRPVTVNKPLEEYDEKRRIRLRVRPGITGYSQAFFRNSIPQEEKLEHDVEYAQNVTFRGDMKIIAKTLRTILRRENIYTDQDHQGATHVVTNEENDRQ